MARCPFLDQECLKEKCQLWVDVDKENATCALTQISHSLIKDIPREIKNLKPRAHR